MLCPAPWMLTRILAAFHPAAGQEALEGLVSSLQAGSRQVPAPGLDPRSVHGREGSAKPCSQPVRKVRSRGLELRGPCDTLVLALGSETPALPPLSEVGGLPSWCGPCAPRRALWPHAFSCAFAVSGTCQREQRPPACGGQVPRGGNAAAAPLLRHQGARPWFCPSHLGGNALLPM